MKAGMRSIPILRHFMTSFTNFVITDDTALDHRITAIVTIRDELAITCGTIGWNLGRILGIQWLSKHYY